jgi:hypothetical protein
MKQDSLLSHVKRVSSGAKLSEIVAQLKEDKSSGCWLWQGETTQRGYPNFVIEIPHRVPSFDPQVRSLSPARLMKDFFGDPVPEGKVLRRLCRNPLCVNPSHGVVAANHPLPTHVRGSRHGRGRLSEEIVRSIRRRVEAGETAAALAAEFGLSRGYVSKIVNNKIWSSLNDETCPISTEASMAIQKLSSTLKELIDDDEGTKDECREYNGWLAEYHTGQLEAWKKAQFKARSEAIMKRHAARFPNGPVRESDVGASPSND